MISCTPSEAPASSGQEPNNRCRERARNAEPLHIARERRERTPVAEIHLVSLKCMKKQSTLGKDRIRTLLNGILHSEHLMGKGDDVKINDRQKFTGAIEIKLEEDDKKNDEVLGKHRVLDSEGPGRHEAVFNDKPGFDYHMEYLVSESS